VFIGLPWPMKNAGVTVNLSFPSTIAIRWLDEYIATLRHTLATGLTLGVCRHWKLWSLFGFAVQIRTVSTRKRISKMFSDQARMNASVTNKTPLTEMHSVDIEHRPFGITEKIYECSRGDLPCPEDADIIRDRLMIRSPIGTAWIDLSECNAIASWWLKVLEVIHSYGE
jgi:hypothetical protein